MFIIDEISIHESVADTKFACDLKVCKGACCTFAGGRGAPLMDEEVGFIEKYFSAVEEYLPDEHRETIRKHGMIDGSPGDYATQCVEGKACVFVYYEGEIAKCAFERGFTEKKIPWQKPISCHLFPIRYGRKAPNGPELRYEFFAECGPALDKGKKENVDLHQFVDAPLRRLFGTEWTKTLHDTIIARKT